MYRFAIIAISIFLLIGSLQSIAQTTRTIPERQVGLFAQAWGPEVIGVHVAYSLSNRVGLNTGLGLNMDAHLGTSVYLLSRAKHQTSIYIGVQAITYREYLLFGSSEAERQLGIYCPIGVEYIAVEGFTVQVEVGPNFVQEDWEQVNTFPFMASLKIGYTFKRGSLGQR